MLKARRHTPEQRVGSAATYPQLNIPIPRYTQLTVPQPQSYVHDADLYVNYIALRDISVSTSACYAHRSQLASCMPALILLNFALAFGNRNEKGLEHEWGSCGAGVKPFECLETNAARETLRGFLVQYGRFGLHARFNGLKIEKKLWLTH